MKTPKNCRYIYILPAIFIVLLTVAACKRQAQAEKQGIDPYYISGQRENRENLLDLFNLLKNEKTGSEGEFTVIREIAANYARNREFDRLIHFLSGKTINNASDPYNGYYLMMIAYAYLQLNSEPIAALYFDLILNNYPDLITNNESIHFVCLKQLIELNQNPEKQVWYYKEIISRFPEKIDLGVSYFMLGQASERVGDWNSAIAAYTSYLPYTGTLIQGFPNADQYAKQRVDFSKSPKDWTFESLDALRAEIEHALDTDNPRALTRCQAKVNFFARSWEQMETYDTASADFKLAELMYNNHIRYASTLDASSNATEAFLKTSGWSTYRLEVWYLYFRKIYFPQDPEIHGRWEWAGIYYGEKF